MPLPPFDALPPRAKSDRRLQGAHYATLLAIAYHDRFSAYAGGQACWASVRTLARETGLHYVTVQRAVADLLAWGYLWERRVDNRRHLRVDYGESCAEANTPVSPGATTPVSPAANRSTSLNQTREADTAEAGPGLPVDNPAANIHWLSLEGKRGPPSGAGGRTGRWRGG